MLMLICCLTYLAIFSLDSPFEGEIFYWLKAYLGVVFCALLWLLLNPARKADSEDPLTRDEILRKWYENK